MVATKKEEDPGANAIDALLLSRKRDLEEALRKVTGELERVNAAIAALDTAPESATVLERIEEALAAAGQPLRVRDLERQVQAPYNSLSTTLRRAREEGRLVNPRFGFWALPAAAKVVAPATPKKRSTKKVKKKTQKRARSRG